MQKKGNCHLEQYLFKNMGLTFKEKIFDENLLRTMPQYLKGAFEFSLAEIEQQEFLLLNPSTQLNMTSAQIIKFANQIANQTGKQTLILLNSIDNIKRRAFIKNKSNFIVCNKQIYIPSLCMYLTERGATQQLQAKQNLSPSAQLLLLYHLQKQSLENIPFKDLAKLLNYSTKTVSLVASELQALSVCEINRLGNRNKTLHFSTYGKNLWEVVFPLMSVPIQKVWYMQKYNIPSGLPLYISHDAALSRYTLITEPSYTSYAIDRKIFSQYQHQQHLQPFLHPQEGDVRFEIWKYDPAPLANKELIDKLSLTLCYRETDDERIIKELETMINKTQW